MSKKEKEVIVVVSLRISESVLNKVREKAVDKKRSVNSQLLIAIEENVK